MDANKRKNFSHRGAENAERRKAERVIHRLRRFRADYLRGIKK